MLKQDQPGYGKPGKHSWKAALALGARRNARRLAHVASSMAQKRAFDDRVLALSEYLSPKTRAALMRNYKREQAQSATDIAWPAHTPQPPRAQRRAALKAYAHKVGVHPKLAWRTYQDQEQKGLTSAQP